MLMNMATKSSSRHYTHVEKEIFLDLLNEYRDVIENKKNDNAAIKYKENAWKQIGEAYNNCQLVSQPRSVTQLKKWWSNMKQQQRAAKTKDRPHQEVVTTNESGVESGQLDPRVVALHMTVPVTAPTLFSSNMSDIELETKEKQVRGDAEAFLGHNNNTTIDSNDVSAVAAELNDEISNTSVNYDVFKMQLSTPASILLDNGMSGSLRRRKKRRRSNSSSSSADEPLHTNRVKMLLKHEDELHKLQLAYVVEELNEKRAHLKRMHELEETAVKKKYELEERAALAKAQLAEIELQRAISRNR